MYTVTLVHPSSGREYVFRAGGGASSRSLYDVASYAGVPLPASCKQGACTACCAKLLSGRVNQTGQTCVPPPLVKVRWRAARGGTCSARRAAKLRAGACVRRTLFRIAHCSHMRPAAHVAAARCHACGRRRLCPQQEGYVALCVATPVSDVKLMTHQGIAVRNWKSEQPLAEGGRKR